MSKVCEFTTTVHDPTDAFPTTMCTFCGREEPYKNERTFTCRDQARRPKGEYNCVYETNPETGETLCNLCNRPKHYGGFARLCKYRKPNDSVASAPTAGPWSGMGGGANQTGRPDQPTALDRERLVLQQERDAMERERQAMERERRMMERERQMTERERRMTDCMQTIYMRVAEGGVQATTADEGDGDDDSKLCIVCMANVKKMTAMPCGHYCACTTCSPEMQACPCCREPVERWQTIYEP